MANTDEALKNLRRRLNAREAGGEAADAAPALSALLAARKSPYPPHVIEPVGLDAATDDGLEATPGRGRGRPKNVVDPPSVAQRWSRDELAAAYALVHEKLTVLTEVAVVLRLDAARTPLDKLTLLEKALWAVDNRDRAWWMRTGGAGRPPTLEQWIEILAAEPDLAEVEITGVGSSLSVLAEVAGG